MKAKPSTQEDEFKEAVKKLLNTSPQPNKTSTKESRKGKSLPVKKKKELNRS